MITNVVDHVIWGNINQAAILELQIIACMSYLLFTKLKTVGPTAPIRQPTQLSPVQSLLYYQSNAPPPSARVDPKLRLQPRRPLCLWDYCKFGAFVATKGRFFIMPCIERLMTDHRQRRKSLPMFSHIISGVHAVNHGGLK